MTPSNDPKLKVVADLLLANVELTAMLSKNYCSFLLHMRDAGQLSGEGARTLASDSEVLRATADRIAATLPGVKIFLGQ